MEDIKLSVIDKNILKNLQHDARITFAELARRVGLTTSPCIDRVKKLKRKGFIQGYISQLNPSLLGAGLVVFVQIRLERTSREAFKKFQDAVSLIPEIQDCYLVSGSFDYLVKARVADMTEYHKLLSDTLLSVPGVAESTSIVVMEAVKESLTINLD